MITGLFSISTKSQLYVSSKMIKEIGQSLQVNIWYKDRLMFLAGDTVSAKVLEGFGLRVTKTFDDAPSYVHQQPAFRMKHWMVLWALKQFGEVLWIDWDTINLKQPDDDFISYCRSFQTPKFVLIPGYHATVNCSVYYVSHPWADQMEKALYTKVRTPNDELMWRNILPENVVNLSHFWWQDHVTNVWLKNECAWIKKNTYFAHVRTFAYLKKLQKEYKQLHSDAVMTLS